MNVLLIEPYVYITKVASRILLYNTLDGDMLLFDSIAVSSLLTSQNSKMYSFVLTDELVTKSEFISFIDVLTKKKTRKIFLH